MSRTACRSAASLVSLVVALVCLTLGMAGQSGTRDVEWRTYGADLAEPV